jgi:hypothetical protein
MFIHTIISPGVDYNDTKWKIAVDRALFDTLKIELVVDYYQRQVGLKHTRS